MRSLRSFRQIVQNLRADIEQKIEPRSVLLCLLYEAIQGLANSFISYARLILCLLRGWFDNFASQSLLDLILKQSNSGMQAIFWTAHTRTGGLKLNLLS
jgi:hypothetical protein